MPHVIVFGSNYFVGCDGILTVTEDGKPKEFLRIVEIDRKRSHGSYLTVSCDIKDADGTREIKLDRNRPRAGTANSKVLDMPRGIEVHRDDGSLVIRIEEIDINASTVLRITGDFRAGPHHVIATPERLDVDGAVFVGCMFKGSGLHLSNHGLSV